MSFPSPNVTVPTLLNDQISFNGVTMGYPPNTPYGITALEGLGKPKVRTGNTPRPRARGAFVGMNLLDVRMITATMDIGPPFGSYSTLAGALSSLRTACSTEGTTEVPLWIQLPNLPLVACMARVTGFDPKWDIVADLGSLVQSVPLQFEATDPYLYSAPTASTIITLPSQGGAMSFNLPFNFSFGGATASNQATLVNNGNVPCYPVLTINGPCLNPVIHNLSIAGAPYIGLTKQFNTGDQVVIDCDLGSILYYPAGSTVGQAYLQVLSAGSTFFGLQPGNNSIQFTSTDSPGSAAGTVTVWSASAYDGLL